jgi:murein L,D-transpeptidase YcbB/YkuD
VALFYASRGYEPAWTAGDGATDQGQRLLRLLDAAGDDGLDPADHHVPAARALLEGANPQGTPKPQRTVELDLLLTDGFFRYASDLLKGRVEPATLHPGWALQERQADLVQVLEECVETAGFGRALQRLRPADERYHRLTRALAHYRTLAQRGGWPELPP